MGEYYDLGQKVADAAALACANAYNSADAAEGGNSASAEDFAGDFDDIPGLFGHFDDMPTSGNFTSMLSAVEDVMRRLSRGDVPEGEFGEGIPPYANPALDLFDSVDDQVEPWLGDAADSFHDQFLLHASTYTQNQYLMATVLRGALMCEQELWTNVAKSVQDVGDNAIDAFNDYDDGKGGMSASWVIGVIGTVIGGPVGAAGAFSLIGAAVGLYETASSSTAEANRPQEMMDEVRDAIKKVGSDSTTEEQKVIDALEANSTYIENYKESDFTGAPGAWDLIDVAPADAAGGTGIGGRA